MLHASCFINHILANYNTKALERDLRFKAPRLGIAEHFPHSYLAEASTTIGLTKISLKSRYKS